MKFLVNAVAVVTLSVSTQASSETTQERGKYLVTIIGCADCHSPRTSEGGPDMSKALSGGMGFEVPGLGIFWAPNITSAQTGIGSWSEEDIATAIRSGMRPDGRMLAPVMPWNFYAAMTDEDAMSVAAYIKSLPPIENTVPEMVASGQVAPAPYLTMVFP